MTPLRTKEAILELTPEVDLSPYALDQDLQNHVDATNNPHSVTKTQVGLGNVTDDAQVKRDEMGVADGVATLDANAKVPLNQLPDTAKQQTFVVTNFGDLPEENILSGDKGFVTSTGDSYIWDGTEWLVLAEADWENVNLDWANIINVPIASQLEAEEGTATDKLMTPLRTAQATIDGGEF
jgi:hypothetical protein